MRRPPEVVQVGLLVVSLLGASGCAGFPQRSSGTSLWGAPADGEPTPPPGVFSWLHRGPSQTGAAPTDGAGAAETSRPNAAPVVANRPVTDPWPESQSEWFARNFPRLNRLWNGSPTGTPRDAGDSTGRLQMSRASANSTAADEPVTASTPRADQDVRPTDGASQETGASSADRSGSRAKYPDDLPYSATPPPVRSPRPSTTEPATNPALDDSTPASAPELSKQPDETDRAEPASFQQGDDSASAERPPAAPGRPGSSAERAVIAPRALLEDIVPAPPLGGPQEALVTSGDTATPTPAPSLAPASPAAAGADGLLSDLAPAPAVDSRLAQVPPAPPPVVRTPPAPAPAGTQKPASSPPEPPAAAPATGTSPASATDAAPTSTAAPSSPVAPAAPAAAPATPPSQAPAAAAQGQGPVMGSAQRFLPASGKSIYASPSPTAPAQPRHHLLSWLFHDESTGPLASPQLPLAAYPTTYSSPHNLQPTGQGSAAACESPAKAPKKPCFVKVWIHDLKNGGGCSHGDGCGQGGVLASPQGGVSPGAQGHATECAVHAKAPKKPCFLKVWIHDWKCGHAADCGSCQSGASSSCKHCKCCGGGGTPVTASPQGSGMASGQGGATGAVAKH